MMMTIERNGEPDMIFKKICQAHVLHANHNI